ncbi:MAG: tetratricopeptide repeat protein [Acidobacteriaceae bacterium]|nr:tetratricopeptide repeat protein [Acidobacteriaceae bacterium]
MSAAGTVAAFARARGPRLGLILIVLAVIGALAALDLFLENAEQSEMSVQARHTFAQGVQLLQSGDATGAVEALRRAHAMERKNLAYEMELIAALTAAGKTAEAEPLMNEVLDADRNDGAANLIAARLRLKEGNLLDAEAYYHRAIYGEWPQDGTSHRIAARMQLIGLMVEKNQKQELLAELLPLQEQAKNDPSLQSRLGRLFLIAGSPGRAAEQFRTLVRAHPASAEAYEGLGDAELEQGDYRAARAAFAAALSRKPKDSALDAKLQLAATLASLDPTPRGLASSEKYQRSLRILGWAQQDLEKCIQMTGAAPADTQQTLLANAALAMNRPPSQPTNEMAEALLSLAERIWQARLAACGAATTNDEEPLRLVMAKLAQAT